MNKQSLRKEEIEREQDIENFMNMLFSYDKCDTNLHDAAVARVEKQLIKRVLAFNRKNQVKAALMLGLNRGTLRTKMKRHGLL